MANGKAKWQLWQCVLWAIFDVQTSYIYNLHTYIFNISLAPWVEVFILHHTDGVITPGLGHGPYLCVAFSSDVKLQDSVENLIEIVITTCKYTNYILLYCI